MKPGAGALKGARFERDTAIKLSLWLTRGANSRVFGRNVLSGGSFTVARARGRRVEESGISGDMAAIREEGHRFLNLFAIEIKHYHNLGLETFLTDFKNGRNSFLARTIEKTREQAAHAGKKWLLIARQDRMRTLMFMDYATAQYARASIPAFCNTLNMHTLFSGEFAMLWFDDFRQFVKADKFLAMISIDIHNHPAPVILKETRPRVAVARARRKG